MIYLNVGEHYNFICTLHEILVNLLFFYIRKLANWQKLTHKKYPDLVNTHEHLTLVVWKHSECNY